MANLQFTKSDCREITAPPVNKKFRRSIQKVSANFSVSIKNSRAAAANAVTYWGEKMKQEMEDSRREKTETFDMAEIFAQLGEKNQAFIWLEKAFEERHFALMYLRVAPNLDPLGSDPKFANLLCRVGLVS
jgi:hypothetical protein